MKDTENISYQKKIQRYLIEVFVTESSKILIFFLPAIYFHIVKEYLASLFFLMLLRSFGGGLHLNHYLACLLVSFLFVFASIVLARLLNPSSILVEYFLFMSVFLIWFLVPVTSTKRPKPNSRQIAHSKLYSSLIVLSLSIVSCIDFTNQYLKIGFWTVVLHLFQLSIAVLLVQIKKYKAST